MFKLQPDNSMEEEREESESVGDCRGVPVEETGKALGLASKTETLDGEVDVPHEVSCIEDANAVEVSVSGVCDVSRTNENPNVGGSVSNESQVRVDVGSVKDAFGSVTKDNVEKTVTSDDVEKADAFTEPETERSQVDCDGDAAAHEVKTVNGGSHESAGEEETVNSAGNEVTDEKTNCQVEENDGVEQNVQTEKFQQSSVDGETLSVAEDKDEQEKESANKSGEDNTKMDVDSNLANEENVGLNEQRNPEFETKDEKHSESAQVPEEPTQLSKVEANKETPATVSAVEICHEEEITNVNQKEKNGEAVEIDDPAEKQVEKDVLVGCALDGASVVAEADGNDSNVVNEMEIDELKENVDMATDFSGTIKYADCSVYPKSPSENAATGEVEPLDHNGLFDPSSDITNFIDFSGVSCWSGNIQDLKTEMNISLKEDKKAITLAEEVVPVDCKETHKSVDATVYSESHDNLCWSAEENQEEKEHEHVNKKVVDQQDTMREEDDCAREAPSIEPNQKEDTEMDPNNFDYVDDGTDCDTKTNGVKRKADVLSEESLEGRKAISLAKVSLAQRPSFKIGACIARAASQMAGSPSVLKGSNFGDERTSRPHRRRQSQIGIPPPASNKPATFDENAPAELIMNFSETDTIPPEKSLSKMFRRFGPIWESHTEVDKENNRARVVYRKGADAEVAYNSAGRFNIFGAKAVNYELSFTITETFKVQPYLVSLGEDEAADCVPS